MNVSLYQAAAAMNANARWQEVISENLSSASIPGFKKQELSFSAIQAGLMSRAPLATSSHFSLPSAAAFTNLSGGEIRPTGVSTNVALEGPGFFEVQLPNGARAHTRDGEFHLDAQGRLVTKQGYAVMGEAGPLQFDSNSGAPITISASGEISQGADSKGALKIVNFANPELLTSLGGGLFEDRNPNLLPVAGPKPIVRQGWLEAANTSATMEMANLITAMRSFEANQRVVQMQDERMGRVISELGNPNM